jgi:low temperature requirement protein LtrA
MSGYLRDRAGEQRVTNIELFFDLVYVFAVTQLSHHLLAHPTVEGALRTALLLAIVWLAWAYTTWVTNWFDPERLALRAVLLAQMLASLVMSAALPEAFGHRGLMVAGALVAMQVGRTIFVVLVTPVGPLRRNFERILIWLAVSGALYLAGGFANGHVREGLWLLAVVVDVGGAAVGFYTPGLGRSRTDEWTIAGGHFAERCQLFMIIALGESIVVIGQALAGAHPISARSVAAFVTAFAGSAALWWVYFDRSAAEAARIIAASPDPGRLGRSAYTWVHPIMVAGIIVAAAADQRVFEHPAVRADTPTAWMVLGGSGLFLAGHATFKAIVWRVVPWTRLAAVAVLALLGLAAPHVSALTLAIAAVIVVVAVAASDRQIVSHVSRRAPRTSIAEGGTSDAAS